MQTEYSPEAQLEDIIKYCIKENIMLPKENIYIEPGLSGTRADKRPKFQMMMLKAEEKEKPFDLILVMIGLLVIVKIVSYINLN